MNNYFKETALHVHCMVNRLLIQDRPACIKQTFITDCYVHTAFVSKNHINIGLNLIHHKKNSFLKCIMQHIQNVIVNKLCVNDVVH